MCVPLCFPLIKIQNDLGRISNMLFNLGFSTGMDMKILLIAFIVLGIISAVLQFLLVIVNFKRWSNRNSTKV